VRVPSKESDSTGETDKEKKKEKKKKTTKQNEKIEGFRNDIS